MWGNCSKKLQNKSEKLQNQAGRIISGDGYDTPSNGVRKKLGWETLKSRREEQMLFLMKNVLEGKTNNYLADLFAISNRDCYNLRSNNRNTNALKHLSVTEVLESGTIFLKLVNLKYLDFLIILVVILCY